MWISDKFWKNKEAIFLAVSISFGKSSRCEGSFGKY